MIYFIRRPDGSIKIGSSRNVRTRLYGLRSEHGLELNLISVVSEDQFHEHALHRRFSNFRRDGEWFAPAEELLAFIHEHGKALTDERECNEVLPKSERDDITVRIDRTIAGKAKLVATWLGLEGGVAELLSDLLREPVDHAYGKMLRDSQPKRKPKAGE